MNSSWFFEISRHGIGYFAKPALLRQCASMKRARFSCKKCGSQLYKNRSTTYPVFFPGRQINIGRVAVKECVDCYHLTPTAKGEEKISRCLGNTIAAFQEAGVDITQPRFCKS